MNRVPLLLVFSLALVLGSASPAVHAAPHTPAVPTLLAGPGPALLRHDPRQAPGPDAESVTVIHTFCYADGSVVVVIQHEWPEDAPFALPEALERGLKAAKRRPGLRTVVDRTGTRKGR